MALPAAAASLYSAATINNAFEHDLNGLIGSIDSTVSFFLLFKQFKAAVLLLCAFLASFFGVPATSISFFVLITASLPFLIDAVVNVGKLFVSNTE